MAERSAGALLPACGPQSSVGVQTSPGISSLPIQHAAELAGALPAPIGKVTPVGYIAKETEYKEVTKCDKEKRAILKLKSGESKPKKEVTFKALYCEASKDATRVRKSVNGTYCYAKAVKSNPIFECNDNGLTLKPKAVRFSNGSVVDSDAIGGICVESTEADAAKTYSSHDKSKTTLQGSYEENTDKTLLVSAGQPFRMPKKICSHCGGRQSVIAVAEESYSFNPCLGKKAKIERNIQSSCHNLLERNTRGEKKLSASDNVKLLLHNGDLTYRETPHPACPVHSRSHLVPLLLKKGVSDVMSTQLYARAITITQASVETRQEDPGAKKPALQSTPSNQMAGPTTIPRLTSIPRPTSLPLTPYVARSTEPGEIGSLIQPRPLQQRNASQSVSVSVHAIPEITLPPPSVYTSAGGHQTSSLTEMHPKQAVLPSNPVGAQHKVQSLNRMACLNVGKHLQCKPRKAATCSLVSLVDSPSQPSHRLKTATQPTSHPSTPTQGHKQSSHRDIRQTVNFPQAGFYTPVHVARVLHPPASTTVPRRPLHHGSIQMVLTPIRHSCAVAPNLSIRPKYSSSEPVLHVTPPPQRQNPDAASLRDLKVGLFSAVAPISASMYHSILCNNKALRNSSANVKNSTPTAATSSMALTESPRSITISGTISFRPSDEVQHGPRLIGRDTNQLGRQTASASCGKNRDKSALYSVGSNTQSNSAENTAVVSNATGLSSQDSPAVSKADKFITNLIHKLEACEKKSHADSQPLQVDGHHGSIPFIRSNSSCVLDCADTKRWQPQQPPELCHGHIDKQHESNHIANPLVQTLHGQDLSYKSVAVVPLIGHAEVDDKQKNGKDQETSHKVSPGAGLLSQNTRRQGPDAVLGTCKMSNLDILSQSQTRIGLPPSSRIDSKAETCMHLGLKCNTARASSALCLPPDPQARPCREDSVVRPQSRPCPEESDAAHSHPANAALLLPPSPQCCESASLQQRLESVEASLTANKERITTLLNIIYDLETCQSSSSG